MLTFEWDTVSEKLEIHVDDEGLKELAKQINKVSALRGNGNIHLMSEDWGGDVLSNDKQNENAKLIHHVKVFKWGQ